MSSYEERREQEREYRSDVEYEVWRSGGNMDRVDRDRVDRYHDDGLSVDSAARREMHHQRPPAPSEEDLYFQQMKEQAYYEQQFGPQWPSEPDGDAPHLLRG